MESLVGCGLSKTGITITYDDTLQGHVINISAYAGARPENLECIWRATHFEFVEFAESRFNEAFGKLTENHYLPLAMESARKALAEKGLLDKLPRRTDFASDAEFVHALEVHCGFRAGSVLELRTGTFTIRPSAFQVPFGSEEFAKLSGLMSAMMVAAPENGTFKFGFVGNEAYSEPEAK